MTAKEARDIAMAVTSYDVIMKSIKNNVEYGTLYIDRHFFSERSVIEKLILLGYKVDFEVCKIGIDDYFEINKISWENAE